jgi:hypothetical protein
MSAPRRLLKGVLVVSPGAVNDSQSFSLGRAAMRVAYLQQYTPLFPLAYCLAFMTQEEIARRLRETAFWWYKRCTRIWLCQTQPDTYPELDPLSHDILLVNEGLMVYPNGRRHFADKDRLPVYKFYLPTTEEGAPVIEPLPREQLAYYLRCNLTEGLFRGGFRE